MATAGDLRTDILSCLTAFFGEDALTRQKLRSGVVSRAELRAFAKICFPSLPNAERLIDLALDDLESERLFPGYRLADSPIVLPDVPLHAFVFTAYPHIANELYPLLVDAYVAGKGEFLAVGVHEDWLDPDGIRRVIFLENDSSLLIETDVVGRRALSSAQVLALNLRHEQMDHQRIEDTLAGLHLLNRVAGAKKIDSKEWTGHCWQQASLPTPAFLFVDPSTSISQIEDFLITQGPSLVMKPDDGTEGRGVRRVAAADMLDIDQFRQIEPLLLMGEHGSLHVRFDDTVLRFTMRLNVCWDGKNALAESGYAQVAKDPAGIASVGCGGRIASLGDVWAHLCQADGTPVTDCLKDWKRIVLLAEEGVRALALHLALDMPALIGIDILLDDCSGTIQPFLLEANARPAGMGHSKFITEEGPGSVPGVSMHLSSLIRRMICK